MITIEAICVGDELLDGRVSDRNAALLGSFAREHGANLARIEMVPDQGSAIVEALARTTAEVVVVCGGLGPTEDDVTRQAAAAFAKTELVLDEGSLERIQQRFAARDLAFTPNNKRQAFFPGGAEILRTEVGTAPGFRLCIGERDFFFYPGVPREFEWFVARTLEPRLTTGKSIEARARLFFHGVGESMLESKIADIADDARAQGVNVGFRAEYPLLEIKLAGPADGVAVARDAIVSRAGAWLTGLDDAPLPTRVGRLLLERGETVTTAESCTAGGIAALITEADGSSGWFQRGFVTYSNEAKAEELGVLDDVLLRHGAVSAQTVAQMASGARKRARSTYALAVSGIAGPTGGTQQKPIGTVHFALSTPEGVYHRSIRYRLPDRALIRAGTAYSALAMLLWRLEDRLAEHTLVGPFSEEDVWSDGGIVLPSEKR